jgi:hypothetical protein
VRAGGAGVALGAGVAVWVGAGVAATVERGGAGVALGSGAGVSVAVAAVAVIAGAGAGAVGAGAGVAMQPQRATIATGSHASSDRHTGVLAWIIAPRTASQAPLGPVVEPLEIRWRCSRAPGRIEREVDAGEAARHLGGEIARLTARQGFGILATDAAEE